MKTVGEVTLETEYEKIKDMDIEHWENIRGDKKALTLPIVHNFNTVINSIGPRPWEEQQPASN